MNLQPAYYFDWKGLEDFKSYSYDDGGLPLVDYGKKIGLRYNAITVSQFGLYLLQQYTETGEKPLKDRAIVCTDWLVEQARPWQQDILAWVYDFDLPFYRLRAPWTSAMAQGEAISLLLRAFAINREEKYLACSKGAFRAFCHSVAEGGVCDRLPNSDLVFEEYPSDPPSHVLNGFIFALLGVYDYALFFEEKEAKLLLNEALRSLEKNLHLWFTGSWSRYDLHPTGRLASKMYHRLHVRQLYTLADLFHIGFFKNTAVQWQRVGGNPVNRMKWFLAKANEKLRLIKRPE
jgi:heparosan-N-sulfate-glucuronate 5-epimerase